MQISMSSRWLLFLLIITCFLIISEGRGGRGRGGRGRGRGRSRGSSYPSSSKGGGDYNRYGSSSGGTELKYQNFPQRPAPETFHTKYQPPPSKDVYEPQFKSSGPAVFRQPAVNLDFQEWNPNQGFANRQPSYNPNYEYSSPGVNQRPPAYSPRENPPPYSPNYGAPPPHYSPHGLSNGRQPYPGEALPSYTGLRIPNANYPRQTGINSGNYHPDGGITYARHPGTFGEPGIGISGSNDPRTTYVYPANTLGSNAGKIKPGGLEPAYVNYGGLSTGRNMFSILDKKKTSRKSTRRRKNKRIPNIFESVPNTPDVSTLPSEETTQEAATTQETAITQETTTMPETIATQETTTTEVTTTAEETAATEETTTTPETMTQESTATEETISEEITTSEETISEEITTSEETISEEITTSEETISEEITTTEEITISEEITTTEETTTTPETTTQEAVRIATRSFRNYNDI